MANSGNPISKEAQLSELLIKLGIPVSLSGYNYIRSAVLKYSEMSLLCQRVRITKDIYPWVAAQYKTTSQCVERSIRHAVGISFDRGDLSVLHSIFGFTVDSCKGKPTNAEFIAMMAFRISGSECIA